KTVEYHQAAAKRRQSGQQHEEVLQGILVPTVPELQDQGGIGLIATLHAKRGDHVDPVLASVVGVEQTGEHYPVQLQLTAAELPGVGTHCPAIQRPAQPLWQAGSQRLLGPRNPMLQGKPTRRIAATAKSLVLGKANHATSLCSLTDAVLFGRPPPWPLPILGGEQGASGVLCGSLGRLAGLAQPATSF